MDSSERALVIRIPDTTSNGIPLLCPQQGGTLADIIEIYCFWLNEIIIKARASRWKVGKQFRSRPKSMRSP